MVHVAVLFHRLGPYHHVRLQAAEAHCRLTAIEFSAVDNTYAWARFAGANGFKTVTLFENADIDAKRGTEVAWRVNQALAQLGPAVVVIPGWSHRAALAALQWSLKAARPAVVMSDSTETDEVRARSREAIKRRVVRLFAAALVAGAPHREYARALGLPIWSIFDGYDVVDNEHFARGAERARADVRNWREQLALPERFFLASSRFVRKKNLSRLLEAYASYRQRTGSDRWRLVLLGDGPLRAGILGRIAELDLAGDVVLPGFKQYDELLTYYGLAGAFVHASTTEQWGLVVNEAMASGLPVIVSERCGCAPDLVRNGVNGYTFDPYNVEELTKLMLNVASDACDREVMGRASREIIADWGPERFADGLVQAIEVALSRPAPRASWFDKALLWALIHR